MPDVATGFNSAQTLIVIGHLNALQDAFGSDNLVRAHHHQSLIDSEYAVLGQNIQQGVLSEESLRKRAQILNRLVLGIRPPGSELEAIRCLLAAVLPFALFDVQLASRIRVVLRQRAITNNKELYIFEQARPGPKAIALVAINLEKSRYRPRA